MERYTALVSDSRKACEGCLFFCKGNGFKKEYLEKAAELGAAAYVSETDYHIGIPCILVSDIRKAMADYSKEFFNDPSSHLTLAGITGTKGKSTTLYFLKSIMEHASFCGESKFGYISSIDNYDGYTVEESHLTTPEAIELNGLLSNMVNAGLQYAGMEVSSQALKYDRSRGIRFKVGGFTNFSEDHISPYEHSDIEDYFASKLRLADQCEVFILNMDSDRADAVSEACRKAMERGSLKKLITFSAKDASADHFISGIHKDENGCIAFELSGIGALLLPMAGLFNVQNAAMAALYAKELGANTDEIKEGLFHAGAKGRMEVFENKEKAQIVIVDFAHNGLAFERIFSSVKEEYPGWHILTVFGCPGNKAYERREDMPRIAAEYAEYCYITEDDPFNEDPMDICCEVLSNLQKYGGRGEVVVSREAAIRKAAAEAKQHTVILVLGKGCDTYMHRKEYEPYVSDAAVAEELMK